jgi:hypothetical protein
MSVNIRHKIEKLNAVQRRKVEDRAAELIAEETSLRDLRKARKLIQARPQPTPRLSIRRGSETVVQESEALAPIQAGQ